MAICAGGATKAKGKKSLSPKGDHCLGIPHLVPELVAQKGNQIVNGDRAGHGRAFHRHLQLFLNQKNKVKALEGIPL